MDIEILKILSSYGCKYMADDNKEMLEEIVNFAKEQGKAINYSQCCTKLKDKAKPTFDEYIEKFYISNGFTYESKRTGKIVDINEITERYRWYSKNL